MFIEPTTFLSNFEHSVSDFLQSKQGLPILFQILFAFGGGLAASLTPCVLPMIPLYLSYIGAAKTISRADVIKLSGLFCIGSAGVFCLMGLFASFASFVTIEFQGYVRTTIGLFILIMALALLDIVKIPLPQFIKTIPQGNPFIIGVAFALVSSPCASPILFAILAMSGSARSFLNSVLIMLSYSVGYTGIIFLTSVFAGFAKQLDFFKYNSRLVTVISSIILAVLGLIYLYSGIRWFLG